MPSATGWHPPARPVPLPRATTGSRHSLANRRISVTSAVEAGSTTANGVTGGTVMDSSWV